MGPHPDGGWCSACDEDPGYHGGRFTTGHTHDPTTHDPLCPEHENPLNRNGYECCCEEIAAARADEREQAAQRVATFMDSDPVNGETWDQFLAALIAAARGET